jgi:hypothetical protein
MAVGRVIRVARKLVQRTRQWELEVADIEQHFGPPTRARWLGEIIRGARTGMRIPHLRCAYRVRDWRARLAWPDEEAEVNHYEISIPSGASSRILLEDIAQVREVRSDESVGDVRERKNEAISLIRLAVARPFETTVETMAPHPPAFAFRINSRLYRIIRASNLGT